MLTHEELLSLVHYDPETGIFTRLRSRWRPDRARKEISYLDARGYVRIKLEGKLYRAARLAWFYMAGEWPAAQVDHRDLDKSNNRWSNLRLATTGQNQQNKKTQRNNILGRKGIGLVNGRYRAKISVSGQAHHLGYFEKIDDAVAAHDAAAKKLHGEFARPS